MKNKLSILLAIAVLFGVIIQQAYDIFKCITTKFPAESSLVYEECTFLVYEHAKPGSVSRVLHKEYYYLYVHEYDEPLIIDYVAFSEADEHLLSTLKMGDKIRVSILDEGDNLYLCAISYNNLHILSYEDFITEHISDNRRTYMLSLVSIPICISIAVYGPKYYKKNKKRLPWI